MLGTIKSADALKLLMQKTKSKHKEEAFAAILQLVESGAGGIPTDLRRQALQQIVKGTKNRRLKKQATRSLDRIR